ncbi:MAG TPA: M20/M25/M40 family metallo-hydrolase [Anaerolineales bacterium]|nr:M20/M25/M40 family metallo-hydrolase [Anaerolineales bacterium]
MSDYDPIQFAKKYSLALEAAQSQYPSGGLNGMELEWNLLDEELHPLLTVGSGPEKQSFVDYLQANCLPPGLVKFSQREVFHWMIEFATKPYYSPRGVVYEARLLEAVLLNSLKKAGEHFDENLFYWYGNLLFLTDISHTSIPESWEVAKKRYLEQCCDLYGNSLATAGIHINLSLPDPLFAWDFMHLPQNERSNKHLDQFKSEFYITASRCLRPFASLFIATSASTPLQAQIRDGKSVIVLTDFASVRNLTFPNPIDLDQPNLYRSYKDYKAVSYDLVNRGIRFGNNNWTPIRARSFAEPVERLISATGEQLKNLYTGGLYSIGESTPAEELARQIEKQNLLARINLSMGRVEIRTDDGGHSLDLDIATVTLKHLLLMRIYADSDFARSFRYDAEDISRARKNEILASKDGLDAEIENPFTAKPTSMRDFLKWSLDEITPLAIELGMDKDLLPLVEMANGGGNASDKLRENLKEILGSSDIVPIDILRSIIEDRKLQVKKDVEFIASNAVNLKYEQLKVNETLQTARADALEHSSLPIRFRPAAYSNLNAQYPDKTAEIIDLAMELIRIPSVTACPKERLNEVHTAGTIIYNYLKSNGLKVRYFDGKYPAILASFKPENRAKGHLKPGRVLLTGHFDVVEPEPDDTQFLPVVEGEYLTGRGSADMKTVVATYLVWMKDIQQRGGKFPDISLLLVGNEENGETEAWGTPMVLDTLKKEFDYQPSFFIAGERTGEKGDELFGEICVENRGVIRFDVKAFGTKGHSGVAGAVDLSEKLVLARTYLSDLFKHKLTLQGTDGWQSQAKFPFIHVGAPGVYNITADEGVLGIEIRPIPEDDVHSLRAEVEKYCLENGLSVEFSVYDPGVACDPKNPDLVALIDAVRKTSMDEPRIGKKLAGTSARFAPGGQAVVWGQTGIGPHSKIEKHYIPSIFPYYQCLEQFSKELK